MGGKFQEKNFCSFWGREVKVLHEREKIGREDERKKWGIEMASTHQMQLKGCKLMNFVAKEWVFILTFAKWLVAGRKS